MLMIEFRPFLKENKRQIYKWFDKEDFFYDTYIPKFIMQHDIDGLVDYPESYVNIIYNDNKPIGLCDFIIEKNGVAKIEIRVDHTGDVDSLDILYTYCKLLFDNYPIIKISKYIYDFDEEGKAFFDKSNFVCEGVLNKFVYKDYKYWDVKVYSLLREEYNIWEGDKCLA